MLRLLSFFFLLSCSLAYSQEPDLKQRAKAIARLEQQIAAEIAKKTAYPLRFFVGDNPPEEIKAYLSPIFEKIQRMGTLNYPPEARGKLYGSAIVEFHISSAGALVEAKIVKTSGHDVLDQGALRSIRAAAPFSPFTSTVKQRADTLVVIRTFNFVHTGSPGENAL